jgi:hypothetical protein
MNDAPIRLLHVCGARPNLMKVAPVMAAVGSSAAPAENLAREGIDRFRVHFVGSEAASKAFVRDDPKRGPRFREQECPVPTLRNRRLDARARRAAGCEWVGPRGEPLAHLKGESVGRSA